MNDSRNIALQFLRFAAVGGIATVIHYLVLIALVHGANMNPVAASTVGFVVSAGCNYALNYRFTFRSTVEHRRALVRFFGVAVVGLALNALTLLVLGEFAPLHYLLAQVLATGVVLLWNFAGNRWWTFKPTRETG